MISRPNSLRVARTRYSLPVLKVAYSPLVSCIWMTLTAPPAWPLYILSALNMVLNSGLSLMLFDSRDRCWVPVTPPVNT